MMKLFKFYLTSLIRIFKLKILVENKLKVFQYKFLILPKNTISNLIMNKFKIMGKISLLQ